MIGTIKRLQLENLGYGLLANVLLVWNCCCHTNIVAEDILIFLNSSLGQSAVEKSVF